MFLVGINQLQHGDTRQCVIPSPNLKDLKIVNPIILIFSSPKFHQLEPIKLVHLVRVTNNPCQPLFLKTLRKNHPQMPILWKSLSKTQEFLQKAKLLA